MIGNFLKLKQSNPSYVWSWIGAASYSLFFAGLLNLVRIVEGPFGDDLDDLNEDALLVKTEHQIQTFLLAEVDEDPNEVAEVAEEPEGDKSHELLDREALMHFIANTQRGRGLIDEQMAMLSATQQQVDACIDMDMEKWKQSARRTARDLIAKGGLI